MGGSRNRYGLPSRLAVGESLLIRHYNGQVIHPEGIAMPSQSTSRRSFITRSAAAATVMMAAPMILADDKTPKKNAIVGEGEHKYECLHDWVKTPESASFGNASHGVAVGKDGLIYISHKHLSQRGFQGR